MVDFIWPVVIVVILIGGVFLEAELTHREIKKLPPYIQKKLFDFNRGRGI